MSERVAGRRRAGVLGRLGGWSARHARLVVGGWVVVVVPLAVLAPSLARVGVQDEAAFLPASAPSVVAQQVVGRDFPDLPGLGSAVVVLTSPRPFTLADLGFIWRLDRFLRSGPMGRDVRAVDSPVATPALDGTLLSADRRTALVVAAMRPTPFTPRADAAVGRLRHFLARQAPAGVRARVTGDVALGADEEAAMQASFDRASLVAGVLVVLVMLLAYRSLLALVVPLATVGVAVAGSEGLVGLLASHGLAVSALAGTFMVVMIFGAGTDYCLFLVARHREALGEGATPTGAARRALATTGRVVVASATIVVLGFMALMTARFELYRTMGPALAVAVAVTLAAACTFTPAVAALLGPRLASAHTGSGGGSATWRRLAVVVTRRPALLAGVGIVGLVGASCGALGMHQSFDLVHELPAGSGSRLGYDAVSRAFGPGALAPLEVVVTSRRSFAGSRAGDALAALTGRLARTSGVDTVRSVVDPFGTGPAPVTAAAAGTAVGTPSTGSDSAVDRSFPPVPAVGRDLLLGADGHAALVQVTLRGNPFGTAAQRTVASVRRQARGSLAGSGLHGSVLVAGPTAQFADIAAMAQGDLWRIVGAVLVVLTAVLAVLLGSVVAPLVLAGSLVLSFGAALGVTTLVFEGLLGHASLSFWVPPFLFVILVALGADYTVLVVTAIRDRVRAGAPTAEAAAAAMVETAPVVSAAGLVLAGSFLALVVAPMPTLQQVGVAIGVGVLADTFVVRPLVVPAAVAVLGDATWWRPGRRRSRPTG